MPKKAMLIGASGLVGSALLQELLNHPSYQHVTILVRKPLPINHAKLKQVALSFDHINNFSQLFNDIDDLFCTLGTTIKKAKSKDAFRTVDFSYPLQIAQLAKKSNIKKFLIITSIGSDPRSPFFYSRVKGELERELTQLNLPCLMIFRPSLLLGARKEFRLGEKIGEYLTILINPFLIGSLKKYRAIKSNDVARSMCHAAQTKTNGQIIYEYEQMQSLL